MHFLERYSLSSGLKIDKPFILEKFFPIPFEKYITIHPLSQYNSKNYDHWFEVINLIQPILHTENIHIVQIGMENDLHLPYCYRTSGQTSINQVASIVRNSLLHFGADSFPVHIASSYGKKIVSLYGNNYARNAFPYWSNENDIVLLEPNRTLNKPSFSVEENPKSINLITPESIAKSVLGLLGLKHNIRQETVYTGRLYSLNNLIYETALDQVIDPQATDLQKLLCRLDFNHNEAVLEKQLERGLCEIVTSRPIDIEILKKHKNNIGGIIYHIDKNDNPDFAKQLYGLGLEVALVTELSDEALDLKKIYYMDLGLIREIKVPGVRENELKDIDLNKLFYRSNKLTMSSGRTYPSKWAWAHNTEIKENDELSRVPDDEEFWKESNNFCFVLETS